jgi:hypothetical protein
VRSEIFERPRPLCDQCAQDSLVQRLVLSVRALHDVNLHLLEEILTRFAMTYPTARALKLQHETDIMRRSTAMQSSTLPGFASGRWALRLAC